MSTLPAPFGCELTFTSRVTDRRRGSFSVEVIASSTPIKQPHKFVDVGSYICGTCGHDIYDEMHNVDISKLALV